MSTSAASPLPGRARLPIVFVVLTTTIDAMGVGLIMPVMPSLLTEIGEAGLGRAALLGGILATAFAAMQFLFGPLLGALSDRFGRRPVLLISLGVMALDYLVMAVAQGFWLLLLARLVGGVTAATQSICYAVMADISPPERKAARFGLISAAFGIGFVLGPLLGGLLAEFGTRAPFLAAAALAALNLAFGAIVMPETNPRRRPLSVARANPLGALAHVGARPGLRRLLLLFFVYQVAFFVYPATWAYYAEARFAWSPGMIGLSLGAFGLAMAVVQGGLIAPVIAILGERRTVVFGLLFNLWAFLVLAFVASGTVALFFTPLTALGTVVTPALQGMLSRATPDDAQGELQGVLSSISALALILSPMLMTGVFWRFVDVLPGAAFLVSAGLMLVSLWVFLARPRGQGLRSRA